MFRQTALLHVVEKPSLCRVPEEASIVSYSLCARQPSFRLLAFNIAYNIILDFILESNPLMQKLKKKFQLLEPSLKDEGHLRSTGDALLLKRLFALCAAQMITVMVNRRSEKRINNSRANNDEVSKKAQVDAILSQKLDSISDDTKEIRKEITDVKVKVNDLSERVVMVEQSTKSAHHRLDRYEEEEIYHGKPRKRWWV